MTLGGFLYAYTGEPVMRIATSDATPAIAFLQGAHHTTQE
jgi:hypothetical protein